MFTGTLNPDQEKIKQAAYHWFFYESEQLFQISGAAGTGKTYLMYAILDALGLTPSEYLAMAYTGQASIVMRTRGFTNARSIHSTLYEMVEVPDYSNINEAFGIPKKVYRFQLRRFIDKGVRLFFIDEAYMVPKSMVKDIMSFGIKVIVCGDSNQLPPVEGDPAFLISGKVHRLTQLMRQSESNPIVYLANRILNRQPIHSGVYGNKVLVISSNEFDPEFAMYSDCVCCGTNRTRETFNNLIREKRGFSGQLPNYGERLICRLNNWDQTINGISLCNGLNGTVVSPADPSSYTGKTFKINFKPDLINDCFFGLEVNKDYFFANFEKKKQMKSLDSNARFLKGEFFEFSYCLTTHLCQGSEYQQGTYIEEHIHPQNQIPLNYTGITRFKDSVVYVTKVSKYY